MAELNGPVAPAPASQGDGGPFKAPWDWHALPIIDDASEKPKERSLEIEQASGRKIWLTQLHQYATYGGSMAGIPQPRDRDIESAIKKAMNYCGDGEKAPVFLNPRLIRRPYHTHPYFQESLEPGLPLAELPGITSIGKFFSDCVQNKDALVSIAVVIWHQDDFGLPDEYILAQLRDLDWPAHAWDWEF